MESIITPLRNLQANAAGCFSPLTGQRSDFVEGYLMAIQNALELAELFEARRDSTEDVRLSSVEALAEVHQEGK